MTGDLGVSDVDRMRRSGVAALSSQDGIALFDAALGADEAVLVPADIDVVSLRSTGDGIPAMLRGLVRTPARRVARNAAGSADALRQRLAGLAEAEQERVLVELLQDQVAGVLGFGTAGEVDSVRAFSELGFDSLTALELRNRLNAVTGLRLPATLVFDHPTSVALARHLRGELVPDVSGDAGEADVRKLLMDIPMARLRDAGVLDTLLELAGARPDSFDGHEEKDSIDSMDADSLIEMVLQDPGHADDSREG
ncbi:beta-ketoacyl reductase [Streptomyces sp. NPDC054933]